MLCHAFDSTGAAACLPCSGNAVPVHLQCSSFRDNAGAVQIECRCRACRLMRLTQLDGFLPQVGAELLENSPRVLRLAFCYAKGRQRPLLGAEMIDLELISAQMLRIAFACLRLVPA